MSNVITCPMCQYVEWKKTKEKSRKKKSRMKKSQMLKNDVFLTHAWTRFWAKAAAATSSVIVRHNCSLKVWNLINASVRSEGTVTTMDTVQRENAVLKNWRQAALFSFSPASLSVSSSVSPQLVTQWPTHPHKSLVSCFFLPCYLKNPNMKEKHEKNGEERKRETHRKETKMIGFHDLSQVIITDHNLSKVMISCD